MNKSFQYSYYVILFSVLLLPTLGFLSQNDEKIKSCENRELNSFPNGEITKEYFTQLEGYINDHVFKRNEINHLNSLMKYKLFQSPFNSENAVLGKNDWIFYSSKGDRIFDSYSHTNLLSSDKLRQRIHRWSAIKNELNQDDKELYLAVWPNKSTIYNEFTPYIYRKQVKDTLSKIDQVLSYLADNKSHNISILDLRQTMFENKGIQLYKKHDTHWNEYGAFLAYQQLMNTMGVTPLSVTDYTVQWEDTYKGDLIYLMGICNKQEVIKESIPTFTLKDSIPFEKKEYGERSIYSMHNTQANIKKKILFFRDSYTSLLAPFIAYHYEESIFVWSNYNKEIVKEFDPDIVVICPVERYF